jgi:hypothetical protein
MNTAKYQEVARDELEYRYSLIPKNVYRAYRIACRYFGEDRVQLDIGHKSYNPNSVSPIVVTISPEPQIEQIENPSIWGMPDSFWSLYGILIYFPKVVVTNENDERTTITDFFARVPLDNTGKISSGFKFIKATFTDKEIACGYIHSHCHMLDKRNPETWELPCLGTGPIRNTMARLMQSFDEQSYTVFFWELDKVTQVESLSGIPYIKLREIGIPKSQQSQISSFSVDISVTDIERETLVKFMKSYFSACMDDTTMLPLIVLENKVTLAMPFLEWLVGISKYYQKWKNVAEELGQPNLDNWITKYSIKNNSLYSVAQPQPIEAITGRHIVTFKGREFKFNVVKTDTEVPSLQLFRVEYAHFILTQILYHLNCYFYGERTKYNPYQIGESIHSKNRFIGFNV